MDLLELVGERQRDDVRRVVPGVIAEPDRSGTRAGHERIERIRPPVLLFERFPRVRERCGPALQEVIAKRRVEAEERVLERWPRLRRRRELLRRGAGPRSAERVDRKSTRLNSSHV